MTKGETKALGKGLSSLIPNKSLFNKNGAQEKTSNLVEIALINQEKLLKMMKS